MSLHRAERSSDDVAAQADLEKFSVCPQERGHAPERDEREHEQNSPNEKKTTREMRDRAQELQHDHRAQRHPADRSLGQKSEGERDSKRTTTTRADCVGLTTTLRHVPPNRSRSNS